jgi:hypothetical protein
MLRYLLPLLVAVALLATAPSGPADAQPAAPRAQNRDPMDEAIARGLRHLAQAQNPDGSWSTNGGLMMIPQPGFGRPGGGGGVRGTGDLAVSALAVMAFLSAGHVPNEGPFGDAIALGVRYVSQQQAETGLFASPLGGGMEMYYHGICTLMLAEVIGMTDARSADGLRQRLENAVKVVLNAQRMQVRGNDHGGWRYQVQGVDADLSVAGWQLMALRAAKNVGCDVPNDRIEAAVKYVKRCHDPFTGGYRYTAGNGQVTVPCTGVGILCLELSGKEYHRSDEALRAGSYLLKTPLQPGGNHFFYGVYYTSQAMFQLGDNYWKGYREKLHELLLRTNGPQAEGAWAGRGFDDARFGPNYCTAMAVLALTVEYRFLPIYQRFEEPQERD